MNNIKIDIKSTKNLLAFSAGIDSTALFFLLIENDISFDIAIVDYGQRVQSKDEVIYATQLAHKYNKKCFISEYPKEFKFNEKDARDFRYQFFDGIIHENKYEALLTAHQLNDKLEWFLMQFTKGAGLPELIGMEKSICKNGYQMIKPLLEYSKNELQSYLESANKKYFIDQSNYNENYRRNYFRHNFSDELINEFQNGIKNSFHYLEEDNMSLLKGIKEIKIEDLTIFESFSDMNIALRLIDKDLKKRGIIISSSTRKEIKEKKEVVISHKIAVSVVNDKIFISPFEKATMSKEFKEKCRINLIPKNIRAYIFKLYMKKIFTF